LRAGGVALENFQPKSKLSLVRGAEFWAAVCAWAVAASAAAPAACPSRLRRLKDGTDWSSWFIVFTSCYPVGQLGKLRATRGYPGLPAQLAGANPPQDAILPHGLCAAVLV